MNSFLHWKGINRSFRCEIQQSRARFAIECRSQKYLEKIEEMLDRCYSTSKRCTRLIYRGKSMFGEEDMF